MKGSLWLVSPVYFDVEAWRLLRERLLAAAASIAALEGLQPRFVVIDDSAGRDPAVAGFGDLDDVRVIAPPFNLGHQRALVYGLRRLAGTIADDDLVVTLDADGEDRPEDLERIVAPVVASDPRELAVSLALRTERKESPAFKVAYFLFRLLFRVLTGTTVRTGNYAAYRGHFVSETLRHPLFDLCYSSTFLALELNRTLVPCPRGTRYAGSSRMNTERLASHGLRMLMPFGDRIAVRALAASAALFGLGLVTVLAILIASLATSWDVPGWTTYAAVSLGVLSLLAVGNFVVLFAVFSQSPALTLARGETGDG